MGAGRTKAREILLARHDFPHCCCGIQLLIQLLMANPSSCAGLRRNLAENPVPYRTIPHGWAFRPYLMRNRTGKPARCAWAAASTFAWATSVKWRYRFSKTPFVRKIGRN
jgi:hypothetical protein